MMNKTPFEDTPELRMRVHIGLIGILLIIAIGFLAVIFKIDEISSRFEGSLAYLSAHVDSVQKDVVVIKKAHEIEMEPVPPPTPVPTPKPFRSAAIGSTFAISKGETLNLMDDKNQVIGTATLVNINDSRCKPGVQCIWAGELAAELALTSTTGDKKTIHLGKISKACDEGFTLEDISETQAMIQFGLACKGE